MNRGIIKSTIREIKTSFGRYLAILLIVALGVGFFSGLKVAYDAMVYTADRYLENLNFYDYHLLSTLGFDEDTAETMEQEEDVLAAEGGKSAEILMLEEDGTEAALKTMSLPKQINKPELTGGRMPENERECLADEHAYSSGDIGKKLVISKENEDEDIEKFSVKEYTIVGLVRSPLYIVYERGTTSLGNGTIDGYLYLMESAYDMDYDTDIYIVFNQDSFIYSEQYDEWMESKSDLWEGIGEGAATVRYQRIYDEALEEITNADTTLQKEKADGQEELADAKDKLEDGRKQITDGKSAIRKAKNTLTAGENTLLEQEVQYQQGLLEYEAGKEAYEAGMAAYTEGEDSYKTQKKAYKKGLKEYNKNKGAYDESLAQYEEAYGQYEAGKQYLSEEEQAVKEQELSTWKAMLDASKTELDEAEKTLDAADKELAKAEKTLNTEKKKLTQAGQTLEQTRQQLEAAGQQIEMAKQELNSAKSQVTQKERELTRAERELEEGEEEYESAKQEYDEGIADAEGEIRKARKELEDLEVPDVYVLGRDTNTGYAGFENDAAIIRGVSRVFPIFFFLVAALVCMTTMARMMEEQRTQIGILKALGYSNTAIIGKYITYSGSAALIGSVGGFLLGTWLFSHVIWTTYKMMYDMGALQYVFNGKLAVVSILTAFLCSAGTTFVVCYQELQEMAASLMRPKAPKVGKRVLLERIPAIWSRLKFLDKVSVRNLFRYKKRFFMMIIGVSGCTALLVAGMGIRDSIATIADTQFETISLYDLAVGVREGQVWVDGVKSSIPVAVTSADMRIDEKVKGVSLLVPESTDRFEDYMDLHRKDGTHIELPEKNEVVISFNLAENYGLSEGDSIKLQNEDGSSGDVVISGIYENFFNHYAIIMPDTYQQIFGETADFNEMYVLVDENQDVHDVAARLMREDSVSMVSISDDIKNRVSDMMGSLDYVVLLVIVCAAMLAFIVIYNLNNINITERIREIATIKVLGFYKEETNSYVFRENIILTLIGSMVGLALGYYLHAFIMDQIKIDAVAFDVHITLVSYIISVVLTLLFNQAVNFVMSGKLESIDMAESLKSVE